MAKGSETNGYLSFKEAAEEYRIPVRQIRIAAEDGDLRASRVGRSWTVSRSAVVAWLEKRVVKKPRKQA